MECSCTIGCSYDDSDTTGYSERIRVARKAHVCEECRKTIQVKEEYVFCTVFGDGSIANFKVCLDCHQLLKVFFSDGWVFGQSREELEDYLHYNWKEDLPSSCISKLSPVNRNLVCDILQEFQEG